MPVNRVRLEARVAADFRRRILRESLPPATPPAHVGGCYFVTGPEDGSIVPNLFLQKSSGRAIDLYVPEPILRSPRELCGYLGKRVCPGRACADAMHVLNLSFAAESEAQQDFTLIELPALRATPLESVYLALSRPDQVRKFIKPKL